jgi:hypothetical protein
VPSPATFVVCAGHAAKDDFDRVLWLLEFTVAPFIFIFIFLFLALALVVGVLRGIPECIPQRVVVPGRVVALWVPRALLLLQFLKGSLLLLLGSVVVVLLRVHGHNSVVWAALP